MLRVLENEREVAEAQERLRKVLEERADRVGEAVTGFQGGNQTGRAAWFRALDFWYMYIALENRYWNAFGQGDPFVRTATITVEANVPLSQLRRGIAGVFLRGDEGALFFAHRGRVGGGKKGVGKEAFLKYYSGDLVEVHDGAQRSSVLLLGRLEDADFPERLAKFVHAVARFKARDAGTMRVVIPESEAASFARHMQSPAYRQQERDYKDAVHGVLSALLAPLNMSRPDFPELLADVFRATIPDLDALGISKDDQDRIRAGVPGFGMRGAMANLAGGRWGIVQFEWIPWAIELGLGERVAAAFRGLVDDSVRPSERVERFRSECGEIQFEIETRGGFPENRRQVRVQLSFVAVVLTGYDPGRYTFYSHKALRHGFHRYAPSAPWPTGTMGEVYEGVCSFIAAVADELKTHGVPIRDLIDAQTFVWLSLAQRESADPEEDGVVPPSPPVGRIASETLAQDLARVACWPVERAQQLIDLANRSHQVIFQGPPGTGKTFVAKALAGLLAGDDGRVEVVQFHPSYAYEDFVEGIRPIVHEKPDGAAGHLAYEVREGVFLRLARQARQYPEDRFFLIIDEVNRANLPRVLGELMHALEYRGPENSFRLPYSGLETYVPENLFVIATMNCADRSIALVDAAIRRRFRHFDFTPDGAALSSWLSTEGLEEWAEEAARRLDALNQALGPLLDRDRLVGHTYLMRRDLATVGFRTVWEEDLLPVLREHLYNRTEELERLRSVFLGD